MKDLYGQEIYSENIVSLILDYTNNDIVFCPVIKASEKLIQIATDSCAIWVTQEEVTNRNLTLTPYCSVRNRVIERELPEDFLTTKEPLITPEYRYIGWWRKYLAKVSGHNFEIAITLPDFARGVISRFSACIYEGRFRAELASMYDNQTVTIYDNQGKISVRPPERGIAINENDIPAATISSFSLSELNKKIEELTIERDKAIKKVNAMINEFLNSQPGEDNNGK